MGWSSCKNNNECFDFVDNNFFLCPQSENPVVYFVVILLFCCFSHISFCSFWWHSITGWFCWPRLPMVKLSVNWICHLLTNLCQYGIPLLLQFKQNQTLRKKMLSYSRPHTFISTVCMLCCLVPYSIIYGCLFMPDCVDL